MWMVVLLVLSLAALVLIRTIGLKTTLDPKEVRGMTQQTVDKTEGLNTLSELKVYLVPAHLETILAIGTSIWTGVLQA